MSRSIAVKNKHVPADKINLRLILVSGQSREYLFDASDSAGDIAQFVFDTWPEEWSAEAVSQAEVLRLIYQGRFLHNNVKLSALGLPLGKTTVMHLVPRESLPEPSSQDDNQKSKPEHWRPVVSDCVEPSAGLSAALNIPRRTPPELADRRAICDLD